MVIDDGMLRLVRGHGSVVTFIVHIEVMMCDVVWLERGGVNVAGESKVKM